MRDIGSPSLARSPFLPYPSVLTSALGANFQRTSEPSVATSFASFGGAGGWFGTRLEVLSLLLQHRVLWWSRQVLTCQGNSVKFLWISEFIGFALDLCLCAHSTAFLFLGFSQAFRSLSSRHFCFVSDKLDSLQFVCACSLGSG